MVPGVHLAGWATVSLRNRRQDDGWQRVFEPGLYPHFFMLAAGRTLPGDGDQQGSFPLKSRLA
jgi:hypothetical protein